MRISDWSSDVCSSDLIVHVVERVEHTRAEPRQRIIRRHILPRTAEEAVALEEGCVLMLVGVARRTLDPRVRGPHQALLGMHQLQDIFLRTEMIDLAELRVVLDEGMSLLAVEGQTDRLG